MPGRATGRSLLLLGLLAAAAFVAPAAHIIARGVPEVALGSDTAVIEIYTLHAARSVQLLGPYSRFGWHHPGPASFYLLLPFYELFGERTAGLFLGALFVNVAAAVAIVIVAGRLGGLGAGIFVSVVLAVWESGVGAGRIVDPWNPHLTLLPFALLPFLGAAWALGKPAALPALAAVASFVVQTHVGYLPAVILALLLSALLHRLWRAGSAAGGEAPRSPRWALAALGVVAVMWLPPIVEQATRDPGNLYRLYRSFAGPHPGRPLAEVAPLVLRELSTLPAAFAALLTGRPPAGTATASGGLIAIEAGLLVVALVVAIHRARRLATALCLFAGTGSVLAFWAVTRIRGPLFDYLLVWVSVLGVLAWSGIGLALLPELGARLPRSVRTAAGTLAAVSGLAIVSLAAIAIARHPPLPAGRGDETVAALADAVEDFARRPGIRAPIVRIATHDSWPVATGIALRLYKASVPVVVEKDWQFMFGPQLAPDGAPRTGVLIGDREFGEESRRLPDRQLVAERGGIVVYAVLDPEYLSRHVARGPSRVAASAGTKGDPAVAVDGHVPAEGTHGHSGRAVALGAPDSFITVEVPAGDVVGVRVTADGFNAYRLSGSRDGVRFGELGALRRTGDRGMRTRALVWEDGARPRFVRIEPASGEGGYWIGEIEFILAPP